MGKAEFLEDTANRYLVEVNIKASFDDAPEVDASPAHHAVPGEIRTYFHDPLQFLLLFSRQLGNRPGSFAIDETRRGGPSPGNRRTVPS
jgi:hypothetical protein